MIDLGASGISESALYGRGRRSQRPRPIAQHIRFPNTDILSLSLPAKQDTLTSLVANGKPAYFGILAVPPISEVIVLTRRFVYLLVASLLVWGSHLLAQSAPSDPVLDVMQQELSRSFKNLKKAPAPPYFLSYQLTDNRAINVSAAFGALTNSQDLKTRLLDVDLRVGDSALDNTHPVRSEAAWISRRRARTPCPRGRSRCSPRITLAGDRTKIPPRGATVRKSKGQRTSKGRAGRPF